MSDMTIEKAREIVANGLICIGNKLPLDNHRKEQSHGRVYLRERREIAEWCVDGGLPLISNNDFEKARDIEKQLGVAEAKGFLEGHASRDPEVAELYEKLRAADSKIASWMKRAGEESAKAEAERYMNSGPKTAYKFEGWERQAWRSVSEERDQLKAELSTEHETVEKLNALVKELVERDYDKVLDYVESELRMELQAERETVEKLKAENRRLEAQQKAWRGMLFCNGEAYRPYATPEGGVVPILEPVKVTKILDELSSEREASRKLVEAAEDTIGERMLGQIDPQMRSRGLDKIEEALRFYATPGHSPEEKEQ